MSTSRTHFRTWLAYLFAFETAFFLIGCGNEAGFSGSNVEKRSPEVLLDQVFPVQVIGDNAVRFQPKFGFIEQDLTLKERPPVVSTFNQIDRTLIEDEFRQGHDGDQRQEEFRVSQIGLLDLLVVIDNSNSMAEEQKNLSTKLAALTKHLTTTDWQMAVVTTDNPCLRNGGTPIKASDNDVDRRFKNAIEAGVFGSGTERGIENALAALKGECEDLDAPRPWLRDDSAVGIFFVSDENSFCPAGNNCRKGQRPEDLKAYLDTIRPADKVRAYALTWDRTTAECRTAHNSGFESEGTRYLDFVSMVGGVSGSICEDDYTNVLERISKDVSRIVKREFELEFEPDPNSVDITVDGVPFNDFDIIGNKLKLKEIGGDAAEMIVTYTYGATEKFDRFKITGQPDPSTIEALIDGTPVNPAAFSYDASTGEVLFDHLPPDDARIKVSYRTGEILPDRFDVSSLPIRVSPLEVLVDGEAVTFSYDDADGAIVLDEVPGDGAEIKVTYRTVNGVITRYGAAIAKAEDLLRYVAVDRDTGDEIHVVLDGDELVFEDAEVTEGRRVTVTYSYGDGQDVLSYDLGEDPIDGSVEVRQTGGEEPCIEDVIVEESQVEFRCSGDELGEVEISYQYLADNQTKFTVAGTIPESSDVHWQVFIDGVAVTNFERSGMTVIVPGELLTVESTVRIIVTRNFK